MREVWATYKGTLSALSRVGGLSDVKLDPLVGRANVGRPRVRKELLEVLLQRDLRP